MAFIQQRFYFKFILLHLRMNAYVVVNIIFLIKRDFRGSFHGFSVIFGAESSIEFVLLPLDTKIERHHLLGHLLVRIFKHLDKLTCTQLIAHVEERMSNPGFPSTT